MKKMNVKDILVPTLALFLICLIATVLLAVTNNATAKTIEKNAADTANAARSEVLASVNDVAVVSFTDEQSLSDAMTYCEGKDADGNTVGYIVTSAAKGYGGDVKVMVGYDLTGTIVGFTILDCSNETPGLGQNSKKPDFMNQFVGKSGTIDLEKNGGDVHAITAATITSTAVVKAINAASDAVKNLTGGADNG